MAMTKEEIEIEHLKQVVFRLQCEIRNLKEDLEMANTNRFSDGILSCIAILHVFDHKTIAVEIAKSSFGHEYIKSLKECARRSGSKCDYNAVRWLAAKQDEKTKLTNNSEEHY